MDRQDESAVRTLDDVVARERRTQAVAVRAVGESTRTYTYHRFCTTAWKTGNFMRHLGVRGGVTVGIAADPYPQPLLGLFGAALLGAQVRLDPPERTDARVMLARTRSIRRYELPPGGQRVGYGDDPDDPSVRYFEENVWSENPSFPPHERDPSTPILVTEDRDYTHEGLLEGARSVIEQLSLDASDAVAVRAPLADARTIAAGVIAPLLVGGTVLLGTDGATGDVRIVGEDAAADTVTVLGEDAVEDGRSVSIAAVELS